VTPEFARVPVEVTLALPSKLTFQAKSPLIAMFLEFVNLSACATVAAEKLIP
jgi:hypothetical protein